eukprot:GILJ01007418.1.p1 GENE.GILJ01007418.1~~GILJ01007418.1.p1  ORF type:complete len:1809 (+),score=288.82 GILJ01007418.1:60-5486(+)
MSGFEQLELLPIESFKGHAFCFHPKRESVYIAKHSSEQDGTEIIEFDLLSRCVIRRFSVIDEGHVTPPIINHILFSPCDGRLIVTFSNGSISIWDSERGVMETTFKPLSASHRKGVPIKHICVSPVRSVIFFSVATKTNIYILDLDATEDVKAGRGMNKIKLPKTTVVNVLTCHPHEHVLVFGATDGQIRVWDINTLAEIQLLADTGDDHIVTAARRASTVLKRAALASIENLDFHSSGDFLLSSDGVGRVMLWNSSNLSTPLDGRLLGKFSRISSTSVLSARFALSADMRFYTLSKDGTVRLWSLGKGHGNELSAREVVCLHRVMEVPHTMQFNHQETLNVHPTAGILGMQWPLEFHIQRGTLNENSLHRIQMFDLQDASEPLRKYPLVCPLVNRPFSFFANPTNAPFLVDPFVFFVQKNQIFSYAISDATVTPLCTILDDGKDLFPKPVTHHMRFDIRPRGGYPSHLLVLSESNNERMCVVLKKSKEGTAPINHVPGIDSIFLGPLHANPPSHFMTLDKSLNTVLVLPFQEDTPSSMAPSLPRGFVETGGDVRRIFWTPFRNGFVVLYDCHEEGVRYSANRDSSVPAGDYSIQRRSAHFPLKEGERLLQVSWKAVETVSLGDDSSLVGSMAAFVTNQRLCIVNDELRVYATVLFNGHEKNNVISILWLGDTLLYSTEAKIGYLTVSGSNVCVCTTERPAVLCGVLADRILFAEERIVNGSSKVEVRARMLPILEPLLVGYLCSIPQLMRNESPGSRPNSLSSPDPAMMFGSPAGSGSALGSSRASLQLLSSVDPQKIKDIVSKYKTPLVSHKLIEKLDRVGHPDLAWVLIDAADSPQFDLKTKVDLCNRLQRFDQAMSLLMHRRDYNSPEDLDILLSRLDYDPSWALEKKLLLEQAELLEQLGQIDKAARAFDLVGDKWRVFELLSKFGDRSDWEALYDRLESIYDPLLKGALLTLLDKKENVKDNSVEFPRGNRISYNSLSNQVACRLISQMPISNTAGLFADSEIVQNILNAQGRAGTSVKSIRNDSVSQWIGYDSIKSDRATVSRSDGPLTAMPMSAAPLSTYTDNKGASAGRSKTVSAAPGESEGPAQVAVAWDPSENANLDEEDAIVGYWRFDEGTGRKATDATKAHNDAEIEDLTDSMWCGPLEAGTPMELEDKWGQTCLPQFSLEFKGGELERARVLGCGSIDLALNQFTIELWVMLTDSMEQTPGILWSRGERSLVCRISSSSLSFTNDGKKLPLAAVEGGGKVELEVLKWYHVAFVYNRAEKSNQVQVFINCDLILQGDAKLHSTIQTQSDVYFGGQDLRAKVTEARLWRVSRSQAELKSTFKNPLGMAHDRGKKKKWSTMRIRKVTEVESKAAEVPKLSMKLSVPAPPPGGAGIGARRRTSPSIALPTTADEPQPTSNENFASFAAFDASKFNTVSGVSSDRSDTTATPAPIKPLGGLGLAPPPSANRRSSAPSVPVFNSPGLQQRKIKPLAEIDESEEADDDKPVVEPIKPASSTVNSGHSFEGQKQSSSFPAPTVTVNKSVFATVSGVPSSHMNTSLFNSTPGSASSSPPVSSSMDGTPAVPVLPEHAMTNALKKLDKNDLLGALADVKLTVQLLSKNPQVSGVALRQQFSMASNYRLVVQLLLKDAVDFKARKEGWQIVCANLSNLLSRIDVNPRHRRVIIKHAIRRNMEARNFGLARPLIEKLMPDSPEPDLVYLRNALKACDDNNNSNFGVRPLPCPKCQAPMPLGAAAKECLECHCNLFFCYQTLQIICPSNMCVCSNCRGTFAAAFAQTHNFKCPYCEVGMLASPPDTA